MSLETAGEVRLTRGREGALAAITIDRPAARNAMTWSMYAELDAIAHELAEDERVRVVVMRGAGGRAFVAGSDIGQFRDFRGAADGLAYEDKMDRQLDNLLAIPVPVIGVFEGYAVGGGLNIAAACDIRIATPGTRFGVPIARTLGNCLSMASYGRVVTGFGEGRARRMLLLGDLLDAQEALEAGFLGGIVSAEDIDAEIERLVDRVLANAPITMAVSKAAIGRVLAGDPGKGEDLISRAYGSEDFGRGVASFTSKTKPDWQGR